jgi:hypothetical protein
MGLTREQKAAAAARAKRTVEEREAGKKAVRDAGIDKVWSMDQIESMLIVAAFSVVADGKAALPLFERMERDLAAMKRAEQVLQQNNVRTLADLEVHFERARYHFAFSTRYGAERSFPTVSGRPNCSQTSRGAAAPDQGTDALPAS